MKYHVIEIVLIITKSVLYVGMEHPSYLGLAAPSTVKTNPAYYEDPYSSDQESMSISMALSSEDTLHRYQVGALYRFIHVCALFFNNSACIQG